MFALNSVGYYFFLWLGHTTLLYNSQIYFILYWESFLFEHNVDKYEKKLPHLKALYMYNMSKEVFFFSANVLWSAWLRDKIWQM